MVEFALLLPVFLIVLFLVIDFGVGISRWIIITNAAREAARVGAVGASYTQIKDTAYDRSAGILAAGDPDSSVTVTYADGPDTNSTLRDRGDSVTVHASHNYNLITPLGVFLSITFDAITFNACSDMRLELTVSDTGGDGVGGCN
ncbi:MAG: pilus assembly protein [Chloroflexi bacterium]|nr:pilus assembly protein [Chloroflexota bacterium]